MSWEIKLVNTQDSQSFKKTPLVDSFCCLSCELFSTLPISSLLLPQAWIHLWWLYTLPPPSQSCKKPLISLVFYSIYMYTHTNTHTHTHTHTHTIRTVAGGWTYGDDRSTPPQLPPPPPHTLHPQTKRTQIYEVRERERESGYRI